MAIGDVDGDGRSDIVLIIHDRVVVLRQDAGKAGAKPGQAGGQAGDGGRAEVEAYVSRVPFRSFAVALAMRDVRGWNMP